MKSDLYTKAVLTVIALAVVALAVNQYISARGQPRWHRPDMRALRALKGSALALDLYVWAVWRADYATRKGERQFMAWSVLMRQMGCDYKGKDAVKDFKHNAKATLKKVRRVYPLLKISDVAGGFYVHPSPLCRFRTEL